MPSAVCTCKFIEPSVCAFAASQYTPGISSTGPVTFQIKKSQRAPGVQPVDQMLDIGRRVLWMHQA